MLLGMWDWRWYLDYTFGITAEIKIAEYEIRSHAVDPVLVEPFQGVDQGASTTLAIHRWKLFACGQIGSVMKQMDVDHIDDGSADVPSRPEKTFSRPFAL